MWTGSQGGQRDRSPGAASTQPSSSQGGAASLPQGQVSLGSLSSRFPRKGSE
ncbi:hypothetical protein Cadr_000010009 [Camelus dromedarius]|uniref:Uncharacterized protein n=1 Tax=Camelus dromedarius TaxID=9838 RepID=A0A5N4DXE0_CAMDR|nr:hypothetical protein Cadr_000010009 [Camelus dromedarius]